MQVIETRALNSIAHSDAQAWLAEHGLNLSDVTEAVIRMDRGEPNRISAWLEVTHYLRDVEGRLFIDETGDDVATGTATIPLRSWPRLTPGPGR